MKKRGIDRARPKGKPPEPEQLAPGTVQAFFGGPDDDLIPEESPHVVQEPAKPPQPTWKPKKPRKPRTTAWERDGMMVGRYPPGSVIQKHWDGISWRAQLIIGEGPHKGHGIIALAEGSFAAEEQLGKLWLDHLREQEGKS